MKKTPHQILSPQEEIEDLREQIREKDIALKMFNEKINKITEQLASVGCNVVHAMGLDFIIINDEAERSLKALIKIQEIVKLSSQIPESVKNSILKETGKAESS